MTIPGWWSTTRASPFGRAEEWQQRFGAYLQIQGTRPQTIGQSLVDSPSGLLAWIVEKFQEWTDPAAKLPEDAVDRDRILTDVSIYWFTATAGSAPEPPRQPLANKCA